MQHQICFKVNGEVICIPIPVLIGPFKPIPDPDPGPIREIIENWIETRGPTPGPWKTDLPIIATVEALAELAESRELTEALTDITRTYADKIGDQLPEGATLEIHEVAAARR